MKCSNKPSEYITIPANTNSSFDNCNFIILRMKPADRLDLQQRLDIITQLAKQNVCFAYIAFHENPVGWFVEALEDDDEQLDIDAVLQAAPQSFAPLPVDVVRKLAGFEFIDTPEDVLLEEIESFTKPETYMDDAVMLVYPDGTRLFIHHSMNCTPH